jgi:hypothetical protein
VAEALPRGGICAVARLATMRVKANAVSFFMRFRYLQSV